MSAFPKINLSERGNTLLVNDDGTGLYALLALPGGGHLEIEYQAVDSQALFVATTDKPISDLASEASKNYEGWIIREDKLLSLPTDGKGNVLIADDIL